MKKIITLLLAVSMALTFAACGAKTPADASSEPSKPAAAPIDSISLDQMLSLFIDMTDFGLGSTCYRQEIDAQNVGQAIGSQDFTGTFESAAALMPQMMTSPFVLVVFRLAEGADTTKFAAELKEKANPNKWICVFADAVETRIAGRTVLFFMSSSDMVDPLTKCFDEMSKEGFNPEDHIVDPFKDLTMSAFYDKLFEFYSAENYGPLDNDARSTVTSATGYGLSALDTDLFSDSLFDEGYYAADAVEAERSYLLAMFRLKDASKTEAFVAALKENLDYSTLKGESPEGIVAYSDDVVLVYAGSGFLSISATAMSTTLGSEYRMSVESLGA